jgi:hypothetical protein
MRLYLLLNTGLGDVQRIVSPPEAGDVVCYFRLGQDATGEAASRLQGRGIDVVFADSLLDEAANRSLDAIGTSFLREWFMDGDKDFSDLGDISLGIAYSMELGRQINPRVVLRFGEILRRLLERHPDTVSVLSDVRDGNGIFEVEPAYLPLHRVLAVVAERSGVDLVSLTPVDPIPPALRRVRHSNWLKTIKSLVGGLRPGWLSARLNCRRLLRATERGPLLYMILGRGQEPIAARLAGNGQLRVVTSRRDIPGAEAMRGEQLFALPRFGDIARAVSLLKRLDRLSSPNSGDARIAVSDVDYSPILYSAVRAVIASQIWPFLVVVAQSRRLHKILGYQALFIAGAGAEFMGNLLALDRTSGRQAYLMPHGMNLQRFAYLMPGSDQCHATYLAYGADHKDFYVSDGGPRYPLRVIQTGNSLTTDMNGLRATGRTVHQKRLLILSFGHLEFWNAERIYAVDRYYAGLLAIARTLIAEGWQIGLRAHPSHPNNLERRIASDFGIEESIEWNTGASFDAALARYDVAVCSASTTFYQSLFAGWPTIFFEPAYRQAAGADVGADPMMTGLVTATDIERPVTSSQSELEGLIRSSLDASSMVSTFPERFATELAPRFIGPSPANSDEIAADFIEQDILNATERIASGDAAGTAPILREKQTESSYT